MKKIKTIALNLLSLSVIALPVIALAQMQGTAPGGYGNVSDLHTLINKIELAAGLVFGCIAVIMFVVAGVLFLAAGGQPEKIQSARSAFIWGVAGVVVGILAFSIVAVVGSMVS